MGKGEYLEEKSSKKISYDDETLVQLVQRGDQSAFKELVRRYQKKLFHIAYGMLQDPNDALDIVQEAFLKSYRNISKFEGKSKFYTWIYRILINLCIDHLRKNKRSPKILEPLDDSNQRNQTSFLENLSGEESESLNPLEQLSNKELGREIWKAINSLPEHHKSVIILREIEGFSYEEIAQTLQCSKGTVMSRLHHARLRLRAILNRTLKQDVRLGETKKTLLPLTLKHAPIESSFDK